MLAGHLSNFPASNDVDRTQTLLPPATKLREGNAFTGVCDSVGGGVCPGVSLSRGCLSRGGVSVQGIGGLRQEDPLYINV